MNHSAFPGTEDFSGTERLVIKLGSPGKSGPAGHSRCCRAGGQEAKWQENY